MHINLWPPGARQAVRLSRWGRRAGYVAAAALVAVAGYLACGVWG